MTIQDTITTVKSEDDAWRLLGDWLDEKPIPQTEFSEWPVLSIKINGGDYQSSLNSGQMAALVDIKLAMGRVYALLAYGVYDMRHLTSEEEDQVQFTTEVKKGSSILDTDLTPLLQAFSTAVGANPQLSVIAAILLGLAFAARPVLVKYFEYKGKGLEIGERERLMDLVRRNDNQQKHDIFERVLERLTGTYPQLPDAISDARGSFLRLAAASVDADRMTIGGIELTQEELALLAKRRKPGRRKPHEITKVFRVTSIRKVGASYRVGLEAPELSLTATYQKPQLSEARMKRLMSFMAGDVEIVATIETRSNDHAQLSGRLLRFKQA